MPKSSPSLPFTSSPTCYLLLTNYRLLNRFALKSTFQVFIFIGPFPSDNPDAWPSAANLAGIDIIFASDPQSGGCSNCEAQAASNLVVADVLPLTADLVKWIRREERCSEECGMRLKSLDQEDVVPFLEKNLHWRVANVSLFVATPPFSPLTVLLNALSNVFIRCGC